MQEADQLSDGAARRRAPEAHPRVLLERRATAHFTDEEVPEEYLNAILELGCQAPSGYNMQPWRFVVVRGAENRERLRRVAFNQPKVAEAPVVIIALGMKEEWKERASEVFREGAERGAGALRTGSRPGTGPSRHFRPCRCRCGSTATR